MESRAVLLLTFLVVAFAALKNLRLLPTFNTSAGSTGLHWCLTASDGAPSICSHHSVHIQQHGIRLVLRSAYWRQREAWLQAQ